MCKPASFIIADNNNKAVWSRQTNSHTEIRAEFKLPENTQTRIYNVAVEVYPADGDLSSPISKWKFDVDQDRTPKWWNAAKAEKTARRALKEWAKSWIVKTKIRDVSGGRHVFVVRGGTVQEVGDGGTVQEVGDGGTVQEVGGGGTVQKVWDGGTVQKVWGGGTVQTYTKLDPSILKSKTAVLIDRSDISRVVVHTGRSAD